MTSQQVPVKHGTDSDWEKLIQASAEPDEGGGLRAGDIINDGSDAKSPAPMRVHATNKGYVAIYNRKTGDRSLQPQFMLWQRLQQKDANGEPVFTLTDPGIRPSQGEIKCLLHESDPSRKEYDRMGFAVCNKSNIPTLMDVDAHMKFTHPRAYAALAKDREEASKREDRELQKANLAALQALAGRITPPPAALAPTPPAEKPPLYVRQPK